MALVEERESGTARTPDSRFVRRCSSVPVRVENVTITTSYVPVSPVAAVQSVALTVPSCMAAAGRGIAFGG